MPPHQKDFRTRHAPFEKLLLHSKRWFEIVEWFKWFSIYRAKYMVREIKGEITNARAKATATKKSQISCFMKQTQNKFRSMGSTG